MICSSCKKEFDNINGLKFCPYCGTKTEEPVALEIGEIREKQVDMGEVNKGEEKTKAVQTLVLNAEEDTIINEEATEIQLPIVKKTAQKKETIEDIKTKDISDTVPMPVITKSQIRKYKREKIFNAVTKPFKQLKIVLTIITVVLLFGVGVVGYSVLAGRPVDEGKIKADLIGKTVVLPKGTSVEIKKGYIKSFAVSERNTSKGDKKDDIKAAVTISNDNLEVKTVLSLQYVYEGNNKWTMSDKLELSGDTAVKPLVGMDEKLIMEQVKKSSITLGSTTKALSDADVKTLAIASRTPNFDNLKEEVLIDAGIDSGIIAASGKIKCTLNFANEAWNVAGIERNSTEDFALGLSPAFSQDKINEAIKKDVLNLTVTSANVFGGKGFNVNDSFTKSINVTDKKFDAQSKNLNVTVKRQNTAGEIKTTLSTDYTFAVSFDKVQLLKKSKTEVESVAVNDISKDFIISSMENAEIEGNNIFLWYSTNHKITAAEAKTFNTSKVFSKKGLDNVKFVYGSITYKDGSKQKTSAVVATYYLLYDSNKGYYWKLDRIVGEDSPNYRLYIPEPR